MAKSSYVRTLSSYKEEARGALRFHWGRLCLIYLAIVLVVGLLPTIPLVLMAENLPAVAETLSLEEAFELLIPFWKTTALTSLLLFLLHPLERVALSRISLTRLDRGHVTLRSALPTLKEYFKTLRLSILTFFYTMWPVMLGLVLMIGLIIAMVMTNDFSMAGMKTETTLETVMTAFTGGMVFVLWGLMIYSVTRAISYSLTPYLMLLYPEKNARQLLKTSRRLTKGHKGRLFALSFTFIGWALLIGLVQSLLTQILSFAAMQSAAAANVIPYVLVITEFAMMLPLTLYINTSIAAFTRDLCDLSSWQASEPQPAPQPQPLPTPETDADWTDTTYQPFAPAAKPDEDPSEEDKPAQ